jgi:hypothetical protein
MPARAARMLRGPHRAHGAAAARRSIPHLPAHTCGLGCAGAPVLSAASLSKAKKEKKQGNSTRATNSTARTTDPVRRGDQPDRAAAGTRHMRGGLVHWCRHAGVLHGCESRSERSFDWMLAFSRSINKKDVPTQTRNSCKRRKEPSLTSSWCGEYERRRMYRRRTMSCPARRVRIG